MTKQTDNSQFNSILNHIRKFWVWVIFSLLVFSFSYSYFWSETITFFYSKDLNLKEICPQEDFKFGKIIDYQKYKNTASVYCIYTDSSKNIELDLNFQNNRWQIIKRVLLNSQKGQLYWPIYL
jgi:hypothetical protein